MNSTKILESQISSDLNSLREELFDVMEERDLQQLESLWKLEDHLIALRKSFQNIQLEFDRLKGKDRNSKLEG